MENKTKIKQQTPIITIILTTVFVIFISFILSAIGLEGQKTIIVNNTLETTLITIRNALSIDGLKFMIGNPITSFQIIEPLGLLILSIISISYIDNTQILKPLLHPLKKIKSFVITFIVLIISILFSFIGNYSYLFLMPFIALIYKELDKNPLTGIITVFLGLTLGYGTGFMFTYNDHLLGQITAMAAKIDVDKNYIYNMTSSFYIMLTTTILLIMTLTYTIEKRIKEKLPEIKITNNYNDEYKINKKSFIISFIVFIILNILLLFMFIPGLPFSGLLLNNIGDTFLEKLFSDGSPFIEGFPYLLMFIIIITCSIYNFLNKNKEETINNNIEVNFINLSYILTLLFFISQLIAVVNWTNINEVLSAKLITLLANIQFSGIPLIIVLFIVTILISILIPSTISKWLLMSPLIVPLFMRTNITPDFTLFIFKLADGIGKSLTPLFLYFVVMIGFIQNYYKDKTISIFKIYKLLIPSIMIIAFVLLLIVIGWFVIGLPLGPGTYPAL